ncbi:SMI1/KNR4 family protein [Microbispora sp. H10836]|uniref:SMI1/KNR4 family protein n=1 Tax=Microbispora sp. H10836 TaxID=2729106 RepID=UPI001475FD95|nr:SMI1/KNR4 family protein [Microbispora sp. H10836]
MTRFRAYMERRAAILGRSEPLPPPASAAALDRAERRIGRPLPADLRALYLIANGDAVDHEHRHLLGGDAWLALEDLVAVHAALREPVWFGWDLGWTWPRPGTAARTRSSASAATTTSVRRTSPTP